jgi:hypothetical protein
MAGCLKAIPKLGDYNVINGLYWSRSEAVWPWADRSLAALAILSEEQLVMSVVLVLAVGDYITCE